MSDKWPHLSYVPNFVEKSVRHPEHQRGKRIFPFSEKTGAHVGERGSLPPFWHIAQRFVGTPVACCQLCRDFLLKLTQVRTYILMPSKFNADTCEIVPLISPRLYRQPFNLNLLGEVSGLHNVEQPNCIRLIMYCAWTRQHAKLRRSKYQEKHDRNKLGI